jgi:phosphate acyltransferase
MKIGLDVMGGDFSPDAVLSGALLALQELPPDARIVLIGPETLIRSALQQRNVDASLFDIVHAPDIIGMAEHPTRAFTKKPHSSIAVGFQMLKHRKIDAFTSAGNTGAMLVGSIFSVNTIQGMIRPCTPTFIPQDNGGLSIMVDVGTNPDAKPDMLYQFGIIGSVYSHTVLKVKQPRVALLNIGGEEEKGNLTSQSAFLLMKNSPDFNFIGNIEGRDILKDKADVIVTDGFTGNVVLKSIEGMFRMMAKHQLMDEYFARFNYENYGGTPLLGINAPVIIGHGISNDKAIKNMVLLARDVQHGKLSSKIKHALLNSSMNS